MIDELLSGGASFPDTPLPDGPAIGNTVIHTTSASTLNKEAVPLIDLLKEQAKQAKAKEPKEETP